MSRTASSFARGKARFKTQPTILILCEDTVSSLNYLIEASKHFRAFAEVEVAHCGKTDPRGIVREALSRGKEFDFVYCVIDRDTHETFEEAIAIASANPGKVAVVASYPCYEFWLLLHFDKTRKPYMRTATHSAGDLVVKDLSAKPGMEKYQKGNPGKLFDTLLDRLPAARIRSEQVLTEAFNDDEMNPSTELHLLIAKFESLGQLVPLAEDNL